MLEHCQQYQISLNLKKCFFCEPFGALLGHVVCRDRILVDWAKVAIILVLPPLTIFKNLRASLGHTGYYRKFIKGYAEVTGLMEKLLKNDTKFDWIEYCQEIRDKLKKKWLLHQYLCFQTGKNSSMFVDASFVILGVVLMQLGEGSIDHPISFSSRKLSIVEKNYTMMER